MPKTIVLDKVSPQGMNVFKGPEGLRVEAAYQVKAGEETVRNQVKDVTSQLTAKLVTDLSNAYDAVFASVTEAELG